MRKSKVVGVLYLMVVLALGVTGCGDKEVASLESMKSLNVESSVSAVNTMNVVDKERAIYAQITARQLLDVTRLDRADVNELQGVVSFMDTVDDQLRGRVSVREGVLKEEQVNYLLQEFEKTPYVWRRAKTLVRGIDGESKGVIVDVTYKTIVDKKKVKKESGIVLGEPDYEQKMKVRKERWDRILELKYKEGVYDSGATRAELRRVLGEFEGVYGSVKDIFSSQRGKSLAADMYEYGSQRGYEGFTEYDEGAEMVMRYVLMPKYVMGVSVGLECQHIYRMEYKLESDPTEGLEVFTGEGYMTITDNVYQFVHRYFTCVDEGDHMGLYKLIKGYGVWDGYYDDWFRTSYRKHENYTLTLFGVEGTKIKLGVTITGKVRGRGSNVVAPITEDRYYMELELVGEGLQITRHQLLSSRLVGEPKIKTKVVEDVEGFGGVLDITGRDRREIGELISKFGVLQLIGQVQGGYSDIVDTSMSSTAYGLLQEQMSRFGGEKKVVWLKGYLQGNKNYALVKCKELFQGEDNGIVEADVVYEFMRRGGNWYITGYEVQGSCVLDTTNLTTVGSLCVVTKEGVEKYSEEKATGGVQDNQEQEQQKGNSLEIVHELDRVGSRKRRVEVGKKVVILGELDEKGKDKMYKSLRGYVDGLPEKREEISEKALRDYVEGVMVYSYNYVNGRYKDKASQGKEVVRLETLWAGVSEEVKKDKEGYGLKLHEMVGGTYKK